MDHKRQIQNMTTLADSIRQTMIFKQAQILKMQDLVATLQTNKMVFGEFQSDEQRKEDVHRLAKLCPEWIVIREVAGK